MSSVWIFLVFLLGIKARLASSYPFTLQFSAVCLPLLPLIPLPVTRFPFSFRGNLEQQEGSLLLTPLFLDACHLGPHSYHSWKVRVCQRTYQCPHTSSDALGPSQGSTQTRFSDSTRTAPWGTADINARTGELPKENPTWAACLFCTTPSLTTMHSPAESTLWKAHPEVSRAANEEKRNGTWQQQGSTARYFVPRLGVTAQATR